VSSCIIAADECLTPSAGSQLNHFADLRVAIVHHCHLCSDRDFIAEKHEGYYLTVGRLVSYKRVVSLDACCPFPVSFITCVTPKWRIG
jgi:hypothetical protein